MTLDLAEHDEQAPDVGELLVTARNVYRITSVREVESRVWCNRWAITLRLIGLRSQVDVEALAERRHVRYSGRYAKGETPAQFFARQSRTA